MIVKDFEYTVTGFHYDLQRLHLLAIINLQLLESLSTGSQYSHTGFELKSFANQLGIMFSKLSI